MKFRVDRDVLADAVAWAARSLPVRPSVPVLSGLLIEASDDGLVLSTFDYETSARATLQAEVSDEGRALVSGRLLADICRSLPGQAGRDGARRPARLADLRLGAVQPADDAGRGLPDAARHADRDRHGARATRSRTPSPRRSPPPAATTCCPVLTGVRIEIDGSPISLLATDRFRLSHRELGWNPRTPDESIAALVPARVLGDTAKSLTAGSEVTIALAATGSGEGIIGFEGAAPGGVRRTTTRLLDGEFPKVRSLFPTEHQTVARVDKAALIESVKRVALVAERNTAVQLAFSDGVLTLDAGSGDEAQASESIEAQIDGEDITTGFNPQFLLDGLTAIDEDVVELAFTQASKPVVISGSVGRGRRGPGLPLPADAAAPAVLNLAASPATLGRTHPPPHHLGAGMDIGLVGLGKMGGNMRTRLRNAGHTVVGLRPQPRRLRRGVARGDGRAAALPQGRLGDGAGRRPDPRDGPRASASCSARATSSSTAATPAGPTTRSTPTMLAEKGIGFVDCGVSGGVWGLENGYALMYGGSRRGRRQGAAGLRRAQARGRVRLRARRRRSAPATSRRWSTTASSTPSCRPTPRAGSCSTRSTSSTT